MLRPEIAARALRPEVATVRKLRRQMSLPEVLRWQRLRGGKAGAKFRRQHPLGPYVADFFCREARLVIEVDGQVQAGPPRNAIQHGIRFLKENGYGILHIPAGQIMRDPDAVAASIAALVAPPLHQPAAGPPPRAGEE